MRRFGAALATLHSLPVRDATCRASPAWTPAATARPPRSSAAPRPDVAVAAARGSRTSSRGAAPAGGETVCLHGDVHLKNGLLQGRRIALIDLDQAGAGPPAADLGSAARGAALPRTSSPTRPPAASASSARCSTATRPRATCRRATTSTGTSRPPCSPSARCAP